MIVCATHPLPRSRKCRRILRKGSNGATSQPLNRGSRSALRTSASKHELVDAPRVPDCPEQAAEVVDDEVGVEDAECVAEAFEDVFEEGEVVLSVEGLVGEAVAWEADGERAGGLVNSGRCCGRGGCWLVSRGGGGWEGRWDRAPRGPPLGSGGGVRFIARSSIFGRERSTTGPTSLPASSCSMSCAAKRR